MNTMRKRITGFIGIFAVLVSMSGWSYPAVGNPEWTTYMMGVATDDLARIKAAVAGKPTVNIAIANAVVSSTPGKYEHDDYEMSKMNQIAEYLGLSIKIIPIPGSELGASYAAAAAAGDIVIDYRSYWDADRISRATQVIAANPDKLFILPYGEIDGANCPPTSTSLQGQALHADGTGYANLVNAIPLAYNCGGCLMRPQRRTESDTSTVSFVAPSSWTSEPSTTCPAAATLSVAAAFIYAACGDRPSAAEIVRLLVDGAGLPVPSVTMEFDETSLNKLKSDLVEMTTVDALGRKMLLYGKVVNLKGSLDLLTSERSEIYARESFEGCEIGTKASAIVGWEGGGMVAVGNYSPPLPPGFPMAKVSHTKILDAEREVVRSLPDGMGADGKIDFMVRISRAPKELEPPEEYVQLRIACDPAGRLCLWHHYGETCWIPLSEKTYENDEWVRVGIEFDYTSNPSGDAFAKVTVNGSCQPTVHGVRSPTDTRAYGPWHYLVKDRCTGGVALPSEIRFTGALVDDLVLCKRTVALEHTGGTSVDGIEFSWFDNAGLPRDPLAAAPFVSGYTLGDVYTAGLDPYTERPLEVMNFRLDATGKPHIEFNGYKGADPAGYRVLYSTTPDFNDAVPLGTSDGVFDGDAATWSTTWDGKTDVPDHAGFYKIESFR